MSDLKIPRAKVYFPASAWLAGVRALARGRIHRGPELEQFRAAIAEAAGRRHALLTASGRQGILVALNALGAQPGDEVLMPAYTCRVILWSLLVPGFRPVLVDIERDTYNMDPRAMEARIGPRTRFVLMTHMHGRPADVGATLEIAARHGLKVIEDAADGIGGYWRDRRMGALGDASIMSFSLYKNLNGLDGGAVLCDDDELARRMAEELEALAPTAPSTATLVKRFVTAMVTSFLTHPLVFSWSGFWPIYFLDRLRLDVMQKLLVKLDDEERHPPGRPRELFERFANFQAAVALPQLRTLAADNAARRENARYLAELVRDLPIELPAQGTPEQWDIYLNYVVRVPAGTRDRVISECLRAGVDLYPGYVECLSNLKPYPDLAHECPNAEDLMARKLYLPVHPPLGPREMRRIANALRRALPPAGSRRLE
ncbi:MAG: aminotransferase class I/II-fold pyridoxal phosphate-dependent enzyme [Deltaproteobacteria bacterium]|nr:aminotransferase class I/II-fold pyridoxal phosphate-dependent enzyme [Deltaproteobacteria bacterium]